MVTKLKMFMKLDGTLVLRDPESISVSEESYLKPVMYVLPGIGQDGEDVYTDEFFTTKT